ncbi:hypothetical protein E2R33_08135 [Rathayibacter toxicus]|uniref:hypothetical protein n=1 Tax=Rathayibacter toxicus TaxID=145458 RepID=UPI001C056355|nr:hypothetical protein [Rathayibacter toxicus]QWL28566.1 hypothetical protein E2R33_08135 [Rathayibacter toxicus]
MTSEHNKEKAISLGNDWTIDMKTERGIERRTIVQGATWTIPAAALAVATPAFAASPAPTLAFTQSSYSGTACGTITGVQVKRTVDGTAPDPGKTVSVTLADGYTFADGTTTYSGTTDANGLITLPDIKVPAKGGNSNFSASSDSLAATAPVTAPTNAGDLYSYQNSKASKAGATNVAKVVADGTGSVYAVTKDGKLVNAAGTEIDTGLDSTNDNVLAIASNFPVYIKDGVLYQYQNGTVSKAGATNVAKVVTDGTGQVYAITKDGKLVNAAGTQVDDKVLNSTSGLDSTNDQVLTFARDNNNNVFPVYIKDGDLYTYQNGKAAKAGATNVAKVFADGTGSVYAVTKDGKLVTSDGKTEIDSGLDSTNDKVLAIATNFPVYIKDGVLYQYQNGTVSATGATNVAKVVTDGTGQVYAITKDGKLVNAAGTQVDDKVLNSTSGLDSTNDQVLAVARDSNNTAFPVYIGPPSC